MCAPYIRQNSHPSKSMCLSKNHVGNTRIQAVSKRKGFVLLCFRFDRWTHQFRNNENFVLCGQHIFLLVLSAVPPFINSFPLGTARSLCRLKFSSSANAKS